LKKQRLNGIMMQHCSRWSGCKHIVDKIGYLLVINDGRGMSMRFIRKMIWWGIFGVAGYFCGYRYAKMDDEIQKILEE